MDAIKAGTAIIKPITGNTVNPRIVNKMPAMSRMIPIINADNFSPKHSNAFMVLPPFLYENGGAHEIRSDGYPLQNV